MPEDGLTTRCAGPAAAVVHTGDEKGKSTAAFGLVLRGWNQDWPVGVFQFVKSSKWRVGEENAFERSAGCTSRPARAAHRLAQARLVLVVDPAEPEATSAQLAVEGWAQVQRGLAAETYRLLDPRRVHLPDGQGLGPRRRGPRGRSRDRPGHQHVVITGRRRPPELVEAADLVAEMTKVRHPLDAGEKGQRGIEW